MCRTLSALKLAFRCYHTLFTYNSSFTLSRQRDKSNSQAQFPNKASYSSTDPFCPHNSLAIVACRPDYRRVLSCSHPSNLRLIGVRVGTTQSRDVAIAIAGQRAATLILSEKPGHARLASQHHSSVICR